jgi:hypothetical protein
VEQNLRGLFDRALDDEPAPPPGDPARMAMAQGRRIRRRRGLLVGGSTAVAVLGVLIMANVTLTPAAPPPRVSVAEAMMAPADPSCTWPAQDRASEVSIFLSYHITASQRSDLQAALQADPLVRDLRFESHEEAYARFRRLWADSPEFVASVTADAVPESFRMRLAEPTAYPVFAARFRARVGIADLVGVRCPGR